MEVKRVIRGDSYALRRPIFLYKLKDEHGQPFNFTGCVIRTTYKTIPVSYEDDPEDYTAAIKRTIIIDSFGNVELQNGLYLPQGVAGGEIEERWTSEDTLGLPLDTELMSDLELTDALGEVFTWEFEDKILAADAITNRVVG